MVKTHEIKKQTGWVGHILIPRSILYQKKKIKLLAKNRPILTKNVTKRS